MVSDAATVSFATYEADWIEPLAAEVAACSDVAVVAASSAPEPNADSPVVSFGWRQPASMTLGLWVNALLSGLFGITLTWAGLYPLLGGTRSRPHRARDRRPGQPG